MMTKKISVALFTFFIARSAFSISVVESEFELKLPRQFQQSLIEQKWKKLENEKFQANWQFPDQVILNQDIPVNFKGLSMTVESFLRKPALGDGEVSLNLVSKDLVSSLRIAEIAVDHIIERNVGGVIGKFRVQVSCSDVVLSLKPGTGSFTMSLHPVVQGTQASLVVDAVDIGWSPGSWNVGEMKCSGVQGFEDIITAEVNRIANDSKSFIDPQKEVLRNYVQEYVGKDALDFSKPRQLSADRSDIDMLTNVSELIDLGDEGMLIKGILKVSFSRVKAEEHQNLKLSSSAESENRSDTNAVLRLPANFIKVIIVEAYRSGTWKHNLSSQKLPGFSTLMKSRWSQFFVWPELMKYSKSSNFLFEIYAHENVQVTGEALLYKVQAPLLSLMRAPRSGSYIPFMNFTLPFSSKIKLQIQQGKANLTFLNPSMGLSGTYVSSYISRYRPAKRFKAATIRNKIIDSIWGKSINFNMPLIPVTDDLSLRLNKLIEGNSQDLLFQLQP